MSTKKHTPERHLCDSICQRPQCVGVCGSLLTGLTCWLVVEVPRLKEKHIPYPICSMYGIFTYNRSRMATFKGKYRQIFPTWSIWALVCLIGSSEWLRLPKKWTSNYQLGQQQQQQPQQQQQIGQIHL